MRTMPYQSFSDVGLVLLRRVCCFPFFLDYRKTFELLEGEAHYAAVLALVLEVDCLLVVVDEDLRRNPAAVVEPLCPLGDVFVVHYLLGLLAHPRFAHPRLLLASLVFLYPKEAPCILQKGAFEPLFTRVRGSRILGSSPRKFQISLICVMRSVGGAC